MTKGQTSKLEMRKKKKGKAAAPAQRRQRALPAGWIQGDFLPSTVTEGDLLELVEHGMIVHKSWRLPAEGEVEPGRGERPCRHVYRDVVRRGVTGIDLLEVFLDRRIQPLQARDHAMWHYTGPEDSTRTNVLGVTKEKVASWVLQITGAYENPRGSRRVRAFCADNPPPNEKWTNWFSPVTNGNPAEEEEEEGSQEGSVESVEYVSDSGETEEESGEEEEEDEEQNSPPLPPETRTKRRHEPAAPSAPPASSSALPIAPTVPSAPSTVPVVPSARSTKRTRDAAAEPVGQPSKVAKPSGSKPRKALPRMRVIVPVTSTVATSATSPTRQGDDPVDMDDVVLSQPGAS
ncbi:hypothetical protein ZWY2020_059102 [Hordeum vulgare]|nr:hypothetical protein ZWY2020_059102 [Hordeum vulgare]